MVTLKLTLLSAWKSYPQIKFFQNVVPIGYNIAYTDGSLILILICRLSCVYILPPFEFDQMGGTLDRPSPCQKKKKKGQNTAANLS